MGLCEELGIERDDFSEAISDDEWARRWEARYQARQAALSPLQRLFQRLDRGQSEMLLAALERADRAVPGVVRPLLERMAESPRPMGARTRKRLVT